MPSRITTPAAQAGEPAAVDCGFNTVAQTTVTGGQNTYTGVAHGYVAADASVEATATVSIRCYVSVDGTEVDSTATVSSTTFATVQGQVTFTASDTQDVDICAEWTVGSSSGHVCFETTATQIPPQEVIDALDSVFVLIADATAGLDPIICGALQTAGAPALVNSLAPTLGMDADDCDLYLQGERLIDFVPYDD